MQHSRQENVWLSVGDDPHICWLTAAANLLVSGFDYWLV
jgi:hypothetical protein